VSASRDEQLGTVLGLLRAVSTGSIERVERLGSADAWLLRCGAGRLLLKRGRPEQDPTDVAWEHDHLRRLQETGFPASVPVPAFDGRSWAHLDGRIWATLTYLPGRPLASEPEPDMAGAGAFLARYHRASRQVSTDEQRPTASGLLRLREVTPWDTLRAALGSDAALRLFSDLLQDLEGSLQDLRYGTLEHLVIHGDPTNDNLIVEGRPAGIVGLIDFGAASLAPWPADIAAGLWRSGRAVESGVEHDLDRIARFVRGYHRESPIPPSLAHAIPLLIQARGLALISRRIRRLPHLPATTLDSITITLERTAWVHDHRHDLVAAVDAALHADA
jgi:Ser/Thr protein kinase RdoA (MazF antagonist)